MHVNSYKMDSITLDYTEFDFEQQEIKLMNVSHTRCKTVLVPEFNWTYPECTVD